MADSVKNKSPRNNTPTILVVFGITGDLATKKIIPSLWHLFEQNLLSDHFSILGFSRRNFSDEKFREFIRSAVVNHGGKKTNENDFSRFFAHFSYQSGAFEDAVAFPTLAQSISDKEASWGACANKLFYLAAPPATYKPIFENLANVKLNLSCLPAEASAQAGGGNLGWTPLEATQTHGTNHKKSFQHTQHAPLTGWSRVLIEKPFGMDLRSARSLQSLLSEYFKEEQIYRIDHYLFKEIIQGIENFRFSNNLFENTWDNTTIERIDIRLYESIGVEGRGNFYDAVGALRDVGQNHLLEILATLLMEYPAGKDANVIRKNRAGIIQALMPWTKKSIQENTFRAQYDGYREIDGVRRDSNTETYFALKTELTLSRWESVPIFMEAGKRMREARKEIVITLKHLKDCLLCEVGPHRPNQIVFRLEPNDEIVIHFWIKKPGFDRVLEERAFSFFLYEKEVKVQYVEEYAKVLYAAIKGEQTSFVLPDEIEAAWKFTDPAVNEWSQDAVSLAEYKPGTTPTPPFFKNDPDAMYKEREMRAGLPADRHGEIGVVGLGKMGANIARRLIEKQWSVAGFNKTPDITRMLSADLSAEASAQAGGGSASDGESAGLRLAEAGYGHAKAGLRGAYSLKELVEALQKPRAIWLMLPHKAVDEVLSELMPFLSSGDTVIDGGNSPYKESIRREKELARKGIGFLDVGVSGGPEGARNGACLMVGGKKELYQKHEQLFKDLAIPGSFGYMGKSGAGHFVKMVHNGIEYGMMQSIGEGFEIMKKSPFSLDLNSIANVYNHGSVITSRLVGWLAEAYAKFGDNLDKDECCSGKVSHSGEGQWTVETARELGIPVAIIEGALEFRKQSQNNPSYTGRVISALRHEFGGHKATK